MNACIEILIELFKRPHQVLSYFHDFEKWNVIYVGSLLKVLQDLTWPHYLPVGSNDPLHEQSNFTLISLDRKMAPTSSHSAQPGSGKTMKRKRRKSVNLPRKGSQSQRKVCYFFNYIEVIIR